MKIETVDEAIEVTGVRLCVYGLAGSGKTVMSATTGTTAIILSAEAGLLSLKQAPAEIKEKMRVIQIKSLKDMGEAFLWLESDHMAEWVIIDSISEIAEVVLGIKKGETKDARGAYGQMADDMMELIRGLRDLPGYNVMMTAKQSRVEDQFTGITSYVPMLPGRILTNQIPYMFDEIFCLRMEPHPTEANQFIRVLQTGRDIMYDCKDRSGMLDMFEPPNIEHISQKIQGIPLATPAVPVADVEPSEETSSEETAT